MGLQWMLLGTMALMVVTLGLTVVVLQLRLADLREQLRHAGEALDNQRKLSASVLQDLAATETALRTERLQHQQMRRKFWLLQALVPAIQAAPIAGNRTAPRLAEADADSHVGSG